LLIVIVLPAIINLTATSVYPAPSRVGLTTELREASAEAQERATEAREQYFFDHPDLAGIDVDQETFYRDVAVGEDDIAQSITSQLQAFDDQAERQAFLVRWMKFVSPALLAEQAFTALAGTDRNYHAQFKSAAFNYHTVWRTFFLSRLAADSGMTGADWQNLPSYSWEPPSAHARASWVVIPILVLAGLGVLLLGSALVSFRRYSPI
jgi:ABC-2 type transport system permease protein